MAFGTFFWENVLGVLNTKDNAFGCFLGVLVGSDVAPRPPDGTRWPAAGMVAGPKARLAWRVLDAQYFGVPQRRKRVFLVADFGGGADPAAVLFERKGLRGNTPPRQKTGEEVAGTLGASLGRRCGMPGNDNGDGLVVAHGQGGAEIGDAEIGDGWVPTLTCNHEAPILCSPQVTHSLRGRSFAASEDGTGRGTPLVAFDCKAGAAGVANDLAPTMRAMGHASSHANAGGQLAVAWAVQERAVSENLNAGPQGAGFKEGIAYTLEAGSTVQAVAYDLRGREGGAQFEGPHQTANIRAASGGSSRSYVVNRYIVRRLTPRECERLQGFPDDYTAIQTKRGVQADGPRYKQIGNSWAVPVVRWLGERMDASLRNATNG